MIKAMFFRSLGDGKVQCMLCPHNCVINEDKYGRCGVRRSCNNELFSENYGIISAAHLDPIEKKPLINFMSGSMIYSIGSIGCNLECAFCQNWEIARLTSLKLPRHIPVRTPEDVVNEAVRLKAQGNVGIAYTYNEPTVWYEFMYDTAKLARQSNLINVVVSNGYINEEPLRQLITYVDAFNIDLKGYSDAFYKQWTNSSLEPVLKTLALISEAGKHLEIAYLVIPDENDNIESFDKSLKELTDRIGNKFTLHINRYFPAYNMDKEATPISTLESLHKVADKYLANVSIGNV
ncbi:MAG: AmmeMemoRadiSam system radical SAM enzyme [Marinifilaceae bacterium]